MGVFKSQKLIVAGYSDQHTNLGDFGHEFLTNYMYVM